VAAVAQSPIYKGRTDAEEEKLFLIPFLFTANLTVAGEEFSEGNPLPVGGLNAHSNPRSY
jgi:hypothetical protein